MKKLILTVGLLLALAVSKPDDPTYVYGLAYKSCSTGDWDTTYLVTPRIVELKIESKRRQVPVLKAGKVILAYNTCEFYILYREDNISN